MARLGWTRDGRALQRPRFVIYGPVVPEQKQGLDFIIYFLFHFIWIKRSVLRWFVLFRLNNLALHFFSGINSFKTFMAYKGVFQVSDYEVRWMFSTSQKLTFTVFLIADFNSWNRTSPLKFWILMPLVDSDLIDVLLYFCTWYKKGRYKCCMADTLSSSE